MRILFIQESDWLKRNPAQPHHLAEMLSLRGHEIRAIDYEILWRKSKGGLWSKRQVFNKVSKIHHGAVVTVFRPGIVRVPVLNYVSLLFSHQSEIEHQIDEFKPHVVINWGILNAYLATRAAKQSNMPVVYYWIDVLHRLIPFKPFQIIGELVERQTLKATDRVLVINSELRDYVIGLGAPPELTQILPAGIDTKQFNPDANHAPIRKQYRLSEENTVLFFMGWLYNFSGLKEVALEMARTPDNNLKLLIVGEGDAYDELERIVIKHNLQDRIILTGKKPYQEIPDFIAASDVCLLPAYTQESIMQDIVPIKLYEYMAMKKPVISTRLPGIMREFGEDNGVVYVDKPEDVISRVQELLKSGKIEELGSKARKFVESYSWDRITDEFEGIINEVVQEKRNAAKASSTQM